MSAMEHTPREYAFYPDRNGPLGILMCEDDSGARVTRLCDGEWLRTAVAGLGMFGPGALASLEVPPSVVLPVDRQGWPDEWAPEAGAFLASLAADLSGGMSWADVRAAVEAATGEV